MALSLLLLKIRKTSAVESISGLSREPATPFRNGLIVAPFLKSPDPSLLNVGLIVFFNGGPLFYESD